jgi:hypothetical protein
MPRKRPKTAADLPTYRPTPLRALPEELEPFVDGVALRQIVERCGVENVQLVLSLLAEQQRREMIERRSQDTRDAWKEKLRPIAPIRIPRLPALHSSRDARSSPGYRRHREENLDKVIREQQRARELENGLAGVLSGGIDDWKKQQYAEIVDRTKAGETAAQIAAALDVSERTVEGRLAELRKAAIAQDTV